MVQTVADIRRRLAQADRHDYEVLERSLASETRKGVLDALASARRRLDAQEQEANRIRSLYAFQAELASGKVIVGLDEVGRGPLAGPLTIGAVVLPQEPMIEGLNDSKQVKPQLREELAATIKGSALAWSIQHIEAEEIDAAGMTASLRLAFMRAIRDIDGSGVKPEAVLIDGNPLRVDAREISVVKGDSRCASIAAASIIAKVERDRLMCGYATEYPAYGFDACKGYASPVHIEAIKKHGLCPLHRRSFCTAFMQESLF